MSNKIKTVSGTCSASEGYLPIIPYPSGYTQANTVLIGVTLQDSSGRRFTQYVNGNIAMVVELVSNGVRPYQYATTLIQGQPFYISLMRNDI